MKRWIGCSLAIVSLLAMSAGLGAQAKPPEEKDIHQFKMDVDVKTTPVKNQARTGTCWAFATLSFLESELLRTRGGEMDLSEMYVVRHTYPLKAWHYVRLHGAAPFGSGGQSHDVLETIARVGIVPESVYPGLLIDESRHNHGELGTVLRGMLDGVVKNPGGKVTPRWPEALEAVLDVYLGKSPATFEYKGKPYTPQAFAKEWVKLDFGDYVELTSYSAYPFYQKCRLEVEDNWSQNGCYYNIPLDDLEAAIDHALQKGYTVCWDGDVSERDWSSKTGYAVVPEKDWDDLTIAEREAKKTEPEKEKEIDQALRDKSFDNYTTTDDHLMHIAGLAHDQKGTKFYYTKNSHGLDRKYGGFIYMSRSYVRQKTIAVMVNKKALPPALAQKLGL